MILDKTKTMHAKTSLEKPSRTKPKRRRENQTRSRTFGRTGVRPIDRVLEAGRHDETMAEVSLVRRGSTTEGQGQREVSEVAETATEEGGGMEGGGGRTAEEEGETEEVEGGGAIIEGGGGCPVVRPRFSLVSQQLRRHRQLQQLCHLLQVHLPTRQSQVRILAAVH